MPPSDRRRSGASGTFVFLAATMVGLFFTVQIYFSAASAQHPVSWGQALYWALGDWYEWALLAPLIFWLCRRFRLGRPWQSAPIHLLAGMALAGVHAVLCAGAAVMQGWFTQAPIAFGAELHRLLTNRLHFNLAVYVGIVCAWHAREYHREAREREAQAAELAGRLAQAQLQALRMQLNPHFLFNTLNAISSLMLKDVLAANRMIVRLSELLRSVLDNTGQQEVCLRQEVDFLRRYLEIEQIRFGDRLQLKMCLDPGTMDAAVPTLILQPLVENAIRHAIEPRQTTGEIELRSMREMGSLLLQVSDTGSEKHPAVDLARAISADRREHVGLQNTRERLQKLYGAAHQLELVRNESGGTTASIRFPFRLTTETAPSL